MSSRRISGQVGFEVDGPERSKRGRECYGDESGAVLNVRSADGSKAAK